VFGQTRSFLEQEQQAPRNALWRKSEASDSTSEVLLEKNYLEFANRRSSYAGQTESAGSFRTTSVNCMRFQKALQNAGLTLPPSEHYLPFSSLVQPFTVNCFPHCHG
jgi:hypothetical protein